MKYCFVQIENVWVNPLQVCYVRSSNKGRWSVIGFHGGVSDGEYLDCQTNELSFVLPPSEVVQKLESAMQKGVTDEPE